MAFSCMLPWPTALAVFYIFITETVNRRAEDDMQRTMLNPLDLQFNILFTHLFWS